MRALLLAFFALAITVGVRNQTPSATISPQEYVEANELSRNFYKELLTTGDIEVVIKKFGTPDFKDCVSESEFALFSDVSSGDFSRGDIVRMYLAETNFTTLSMVFGAQRDDGDEDLTRNSFPNRFQKLAGKKTIDFILSSDDSKQPQDFMKIVRSLERANPAFRKEVKRANLINSEKLSRRLNWLETESTVAEYMFRPELSNKTKACGINPESTHVINVDVPLYQLQLVRIDGKLKAFRYVVHVH